MLDLELPTTQKPSLYTTQAFNFFANKALIKRFIAQYQGKVYLAEYFPMGKIKMALFKFLGIHFNDNKTKIIKMFYSSLHKFSPEFLKAEFKMVNKKDYIIALGTISPGIHRNDPNIKLKTLKRDISLAKKAEIKEIIIFRLGGLNKNYKKILTKL